MSSISKNVIYSVLTQIPTQIFGIIAGIFITRILGPSGRGLYAIFYADVSLFATVLDFSIITAIIYYYSSKKLNESKLLGVSIVFTSITMLLSTLLLVIWINTPYANLLFPLEAFKWQMVWFFLIFLFTSQINTVYSGFFQGAKKFNIVNKVLLVNGAANLLLFGLAFFFHFFTSFKMNLDRILIIGLIVLVINTIQWHFYFVKHFSYKFDFGFNWKRDIKPFFQFMGLGHLSIVINFFNYRLVLWILAYYLEESEVGIFTLAAGLTQMLYFISTPLSQVLMPYLSADSHENRILTFQRFARLHFTLIIILAFVGLAIAPFLIPLLYGKEFVESVIPFEILMLGVILSCQTKVFGSYLVSVGKVKVNLIATTLGFLLTVIFNFTLIKDYGIIGASLSQAITLIGIFLVVYVAIIIFARVGTRNLFFVNSEDVKYARAKLKRKPR